MTFASFDEDPSQVGQGLDLITFRGIQLHSLPAVTNGTRNSSRTHFVGHKVVMADTLHKAVAIGLPPLETLAVQFDRARKVSLLASDIAQAIGCQRRHPSIV